MSCRPNENYHLTFGGIGAPHAARSCRAVCRRPVHPRLQRQARKPPGYRRTLPVRPTVLAASSRGERTIQSSSYDALSAGGRSLNLPLHRTSRVVPGGSAPAAPTAFSAPRPGRVWDRLGPPRTVNLPVPHATRGSVIARARTTPRARRACRRPGGGLARRRARARAPELCAPDRRDCVLRFTLPSSIVPRQAPVSSSCISMYALKRCRSPRAARLTCRAPRANFSIRSKSRHRPPFCSQAIRSPRPLRASEPAEGTTVRSDCQLGSLSRVGPTVSLALPNFQNRNLQAKST